jgi:hypothetical protein
MCVNGISIDLHAYPFACAALAIGDGNKRSACAFRGVLCLQRLSAFCAGTTSTL